jgi:hypothetical protein
VSADKFYPFKRLSLGNIMEILFKSVGFFFEGYIHIGLIVISPFHPSKKIKTRIEYPMKNKKQFYLLPEMDQLMIQNSLFVLYTLPTKNEDEKRKAMVISK